MVSELENCFILQATSYDLNKQLTYHINENSMSVSHSSLQHLIGRNPFKIDGDQLRLNFDVQDAAMKGIFTFKVEVTNSGQFLQYWSFVRI